MTINTDQLLESILDSLDRIDYVKSEDIPDIQLYMDQVTTFMDSHLASTRRYPSDKILTTRYDACTVLLRTVFPMHPKKSRISYGSSLLSAC